MGDALILLMTFLTKFLCRAMKEVLPSLPNYWHEVAALLNTGHTAEQCQQYNHKDIPDVLNKPKGRKNKNTKGIIVCQELGCKYYVCILH